MRIFVNFVLSLFILAFGNFTFSEEIEEPLMFFLKSP